MPVVLVGTSHKRSPLWVREKVSLSGISLFDTRKRLHSWPDIDELVVVSTCNRVEFYAAGRDCDACIAALRGFLEQEYGFSSSEMEDNFYYYRGRDVARHMLEVAVGADSMVLGETQILSQIHQGFEQAASECTAGPELTRLCDAADNLVKRVREETRFHCRPVSVGSVAVDMARDFLTTLKNRSAMILGAGEMGILTARSLSANGIATILVANRTLSRAQDVAHSLGGRAVDYTELSSQIAKVDVLVTSTRAPHVLIKKSMIESIMNQRPKKPLFIIDLAVPRNVDHGANELAGVTLVNVDGLQETAEKNSQERMAELDKVRLLVDDEIEKFMREKKPKGISLMDLATC